MFAAEPQIEVLEGFDYWKNAELTNGRLAMIGFFAAIHNYILFGQVMPGIFQISKVFTPLAQRVTFNPQSKKENKTMTPEAEKFNGWMAMLGITAALGAYATTGQIIPGIF